jgi:hypothetical protein
VRRLSSSDATDGHLQRAHLNRSGPAFQQRFLATTRIFGGGVKTREKAYYLAYKRGRRPAVERVVGIIDNQHFVLAIPFGNVHQPVAVIPRVMCALARIVRLPAVNEIAFGIILVSVRAIRGETAVVARAAGSKSPSIRLPPILANRLPSPLVHP